MYRILQSLTALALVASSLGCHCVCGVCDCDLPPGVRTASTPPPLAPVVAVSATVPAAAPKAPTAEPDK
jgi:hypothetical protein